MQLDSQLNGLVQDLEHCVQDFQADMYNMAEEMSQNLQTQYQQWKNRHSPTHQLQPMPCGNCQIHVPQAFKDSLFANPYMPSNVPSNPDISD